MKFVLVFTVVAGLGTAIAEPPEISLRNAPAEWSMSQSAPRFHRDAAPKITVAPMAPEEMVVMTLRVKKVAIVMPGLQQPCYAIRSYNFKSKNGVPKLKNETICTQSGKLMPAE